MSLKLHTRSLYGGYAAIPKLCRWEAFFCMNNVAKYIVMSKRTVCQHDLSLQIFQHIWGTTELLSSFDSINVLRPGSHVVSTDDWLHCDQAPHRKGLACIQGLVNMVDVGPDTGNWQNHAVPCVPAVKAANVALMCILAVFSPFLPAGVPQTDAIPVADACCTLPTEHCLYVCVPL